MVLELDQVTATVEAQTHLYPASLRPAPGTINVLLGPTQAGKTTLIRIMAGLDRPTTGHVLIDSKDVTGVGIHDRNLAMMHQQFINYPAMTVYDNITSSLHLRSTSKGEIDTRVWIIVSKLYIDHLLQRLSAELSGGQQQRCALARTLIKQASLVLPDELLVNLDYKSREELRIELASLLADGGTIVVYTITEPQEALLLGGHTVVIHEGHVLQDGPMFDMYEVSVLVNAVTTSNNPPMNVLDATVVESNQVRLPQGIDAAWARPLPVAAGTCCRIGLRPSRIHLAPHNGDAVALPGTVELTESSGFGTYLHVRAHVANQSNTIDLVTQLPGVHEFELDATLDVLINPVKLFLFSDTGKLVSTPKQGGIRGTH